MADAQLSFAMDRVRTATSAMGYLLILAVGIPALLIALVLFFQERIIFPATRDLYRTPASPPFQWEYEDVFLDVGEGDVTHGWFIPLEKARGTALFSHGNAGNIADRLESIHLLRELGFSVFAYDYGGYGRSSGKPTEQRLYRDVCAAWRYLTGERGISAQEILLFGRSMGGAATAYLASKVTPAAVALESTFTSIPDVVQGMPLGFLFSPFIRHRLNSIARIPHIQAPLLIIHSPDDRTIPFSHGKKLFEAAHPPKTFVEIKGDHNDGFVLSMDMYLEAWEKFLADIMPRQPV